MYKYNLLTRLDKLSINDREIFWKWAPDQLCRNKATIRDWCYIKNDASNEISSTCLIKLSVFFQCTPEELFTEPVDKYKVQENITKAYNHVHSRN